VFRKFSLASLGTIRLRLTLWYIALLTLILLGFSGALYFVVSRALYQQVDDSLALNAHQLISGFNIENGQLDPNTESNPGDLEAMRNSGYIVRVLDQNAKVLATNAANSNVQSANSASGSVLPNSDTFETVSSKGELYRLYTASIQDNGQVLGALQIGQSLEGVGSTLQQLLLALALIVPLTLLVASFGGIWYARRALMPIDQITRAAQQISAHDLSQRLNMNLPEDEVGRLARTFDAMLARLDESFQREREFTANASHELRTPLTVMRGEIDIVLERRREVSEYEQVLRELGTDVERLTRVAEDLLTLALADVHQLAVTREKLNAEQLLETVAEELRPVADAKKITLEVRAAPDIVFRGDEPKMLRVLFNLLDNALKFSPSGTTITLSAEREGNLLNLYVSDQGPGIAPEALPHIFDRFYRGTNGRAPGTGLGLAIARALVLAQDGTLEVTTTPPKGATFTVQMHTSSS